MRKTVRVVGLAILLSGLSSKHASARKPYFDGFKEKYANEGGFGYDKLIDQAKCAICHKGQAKKDRNSYGIALSKVITKNQKNKVQIDKALGDIENEKSPLGETFIELIRQGKLPGANG
jgi:cytochrome c peroxidase